MAQMPAEAAAPAPEEGSGNGGAAKLVVDINSMLEQLGSLLDKSGVLDPESANRFQQIISGYQDFVQNDLSTAPGESRQAVPSSGGAAPMETMGRAAKPAL